MTKLNATVSLLALVAFPAQAWAADGDDWSGIYGGVHGTILAGDAEWSGTNIYETLDGPEGSAVSNRQTIAAEVSKTRGGGGARLGFNYQTGQLVLGIEGDVNFGGRTDIAALGGTTAPQAGYSLQTRSNVLGTMRARAGIAFDRILLFGTGGLALTNQRHTVTTGSGLSASVRNSSGWAGGGGAEFRLSDSLSVAATVLHVELGLVNFAGSGGTNSFTTNVESSYTVGSVGLNLRF